MVTMAVHTYKLAYRQTYMISVFFGFPDFYISGNAGFLEITKFQKYENIQNKETWKSKKTESMYVCRQTCMYI